MSDGRRLLQIGEVAELVGLSLRTVRYYEEMGLIEPSGRSPGGFRLFDEEQIKRLRILKGMKPVGLALDEIRELMELLDRTSSLDELDAETLVELADRLSRYEELTAERVERLKRHVAEGIKLHDWIEGSLQACRAALQHAAASRSG